MRCTTTSTTCYTIIWKFTFYHTSISIVFSICTSTYIFLSELTSTITTLLNTKLFVPDTFHALITTTSITYLSNPNAAGRLTFCIPTSTRIFSTSANKIFIWWRVCSVASSSTSCSSVVYYNNWLYFNSLDPCLKQ